MMSESVKACGGDGRQIESVRLTYLVAFRGLDREPVSSAEAGDIVAIAGLQKATVADTICAASVTEALPARPVSPPTMAMTVAVNDGPLAGKDGTKLTGRMIGDRLKREAESNVAIRVTESADKDAFEVAGRGELAQFDAERTVDLDGHFVAPGFNDAHNHMQAYGATLNEVPLHGDAVHSIEELVAAIAERDFRCAIQQIGLDCVS